MTHVSKGERAYHIFYGLLRGLNAKECGDLKLEHAKPSSYRYLSCGETGAASERMDDVQIWNLVVQSLSDQAISKDEQTLYWQCLAGVLHLGNVEFDPKNRDEGVPTSGAAAALQKCEVVLGLQSGLLQKALCKRKIKAGNEFIEQPLSHDQACDGRDALSKAIYSRLFDRLIAQINTALKAGGEAAGEAERRIIGVVDIFGFEVFGVNSLEQLCINFANEKLQALFTKAVFKETIAAYEADGIKADEITYQDNASLIEMFDTPKVGLWAVLTEECVVPKGTDGGFSEKLHAAQKGCKVISIVKGKAASEGFGIAHFAGAVTYSSNGWLNKNKDPLNGDLMVLMQFSDNAVLKALFSQQVEAPAAGQKFKSNKFKGVVDAFRTGLDSLVGVLEQSQLHFVRCFKPNDTKAAKTWDPPVVTRQLHTSGVLDALRVARTGFPDRLPFGEFVSTFAFIGGLPKDIAPTQASCEKLVGILKLGDKIKLGRSKIFMGLGVLDSLKTLRVKAMAGVAIKIQAAGRGLASRKRARAVRAARAEKKDAMAAAAKGDSMEALMSAIDAAVKAGVGKSKFDEPGRAALSGAKQRLAALELADKERKAAAAALDKEVDGGMDVERSKEIKNHVEAAGALGKSLAALGAALEAAKATGVDPTSAGMKKAEAKLTRLKEEEARRKAEEQRRLEEEKRRKEEEERLANMKAAEKAAEEKRVAEERKKREAEEKRLKDEADQKAAATKAAVDADLAAEEAARMAALRAESMKEENAARGAEEASMRAQMEAEEAEARALEEEEALRQKVLSELQRANVKFRSAPEDVLEYAVYLGMQLDEDKELLWIADQALQAEDPEGWSQCESPNGDLYYVNQVTMQVLWQHPLDYQYQQTYLEEKKRLLGGGAPSKPPEGPSPGARGGGAEEKSETSGEVSPAPPSSSGGGGADIKVSDDQLRGLLHSVLGSKHGDLRSLLLEPAASQKLIKCYVLRHKARMGGGSRFDFFMSLSPTNDMYCFTGKKQAASKGCYYSISLDQEESKRSKNASESFIGKVRSDRKSMEYTLYDDGAAPDDKKDKKGGEAQLRRELLYVNFINSLRNRNPGAMEVVVPRVDKAGTPVIVRPGEGGNKDGLADKHKAGATPDVITLKNREPKWNPASNMYQLDFQGRATMASCKNIQLHPKETTDSDVCFLMGKVDDNKFNVDFKHPMSCLQAFSFALIVFDNSSGL